jgi:YVTN family beta-propeller protein
LPGADYHGKQYTCHAEKLLAASMARGLQSHQAEHAVFSPDGRWLLVSAENADQVDLIDVGARRQVGSIAVGLRPRGIGFTPDGKRAYVACELAGAVYVLDPAGIAVGPGGRQVYVSNGADGSVMAIDPVRQAVSATIAVGKRPWNMALTPDGSRLYVANGRSDSVSVIDTAGVARVADIPVGQLPWGVVIR